MSGVFNNHVEMESLNIFNQDHSDLDHILYTNVYCQLKKAPDHRYGRDDPFAKAAGLSADSFFFFGQLSREFKAIFLFLAVLLFGNFVSAHGIT